MGISVENMPYIFNRLYKGNKGRGARGSGLGLAIVSELVKEHKGTIEVVRSEKNTSFKINLPSKSFI